MGKKLANNPAHRVDPGCKADRLRARDHRCVQPDDFTAELTSGPPELPGFKAALVWMMLSISLPLEARTCDQAL